MITLQVLFVIVYAICIAIFFFMPKKAFLNTIQRDMDKDFNPGNLKDINTYGANYYKIILLGATIVAALITFISKLLFY